VFLFYHQNEKAPNRFKLSNHVSVIQTMFVFLNREPQQPKAISVKQKSDNFALIIQSIMVLSQFAFFGADDRN
jgi:hypothetical protein